MAGRQGTSWTAGWLASAAGPVPGRRGLNQEEAWPGGWLGGCVGLPAPHRMDLQSNSVAPMHPLRRAKEDVDPPSYQRQGRRKGTVPPPEKAADIESELWRQHSLSTDLGTSCVALSEPCQLFDRASSSKNKSLSCSQLLQVSHCQLLNMKKVKIT